MASDAAVSHVILPDGLECFVVDNPNVSAFTDFALVSRKEGRAAMCLDLLHKAEQR